MTNLNAMIFGVPGGFPGSLVTECASYVETADLDYLLGSNLQFGTPLKALPSGQLSAFEPDDSVALLYGFLVRYVPSANGGGSNNYLQGSQDSTYSAGVLIAGAMRVICAAGTPVRGKNVFIRNLAGVSVYPIGTVAASAVDATFTQLPNVIWVANGVDPQNLALIRIFPTEASGIAAGILPGAGITITGSPGAETISVTATPFVLSLFASVDATAFRAALGLGTLATQDANAVNITGGTLDSVTITNSTIS